MSCLFANVIETVPADDLRRNLIFKVYTLNMLMMVSKNVKEAISKIKLITFVTLSFSEKDRNERKVYVKAGNALNGICGLSILCTITKLVLKSCKIKEGLLMDRLSNVLKQCQGLEELDLEDNMIGNGIGIIAEQLSNCPKLRILDLGSTEINEDGAKSLAQALGQGQCPELEKLLLHRNHIGDAGMKSLAGVLPQFEKLKHLTLDDNNITQNGAKSLTRVLPECKTLAVLELWANILGDKGAERLAKVLPQCGAMTCLVISGNGIGSEGAASIAGVLPKCKVLSCLQIGSNEFGNAGAKSLARALPQCKLNELDVKYSRISNEGANSFRQVLSKCLELKKLNLNGNMISDETSERLGDVLIEHRPDLECSISFYKH
jgi:Ran GTPase-activating protein (RanGAP) involved in mRNA processing and transport